MRHLEHKKWIADILSIAILIVILTVSVNYINDPLWVFSHSNVTNKEQAGFNERQQKTNRLYFSNQKHDSVLLGNSKVTYINQNQFKKGKLFNYAVSAMKPTEYEGYIKFAKEVNGGDLKYIIIGIDFSSCTNQKDKNKNHNPEFYINNTKSKFYQYKTLLSYDSFLYSLRNLIKYFDNKKAVYDRNNIKVKIGYDNIDENFKFDLDSMTEGADEDYKNKTYNSKLINIFKRIKNGNLKSEFIILFLPDLLPKFLLSKNGKKIYDHCLGDASEIFGKIYNFMYFSPINSHPKHYYDGSHFRPYVGKILMDNISTFVKN
jgi:hypothetical protein